MMTKDNFSESPKPDLDDDTTKIAKWKRVSILKSLKIIFI